MLTGLEAASIVDGRDTTRVLERCRDMAAVRLDDVLAVCIKLAMRPIDGTAGLCTSTELLDN